jgi:hypothetical protein
VAPFLHLHHTHLLLASALVMTLVTAVAALVSLQWQAAAEQHNRLRIKLFQAWETAIPPFMFGTTSQVPPEILDLPAEAEALLRLFLQQVRSGVQGLEGQRIKTLYHAAGLDRGLAQRLTDPSPKIRALAAIEVGKFHVLDRYPQLVPMLKDPVPYVAHAAATSLCHGRQLPYASQVVLWVLTQPHFEQDSLLPLLERFGPELLYMLSRTLRNPNTHPREWRIYALLAMSHRHAKAFPTLRALLKVPDLELKAACLKALATMGDEDTYPDLVRYARNRDFRLRIQAAKYLGQLGGERAVPILRELMEDRVFELRRQACLSLAELGEPGLAVLEGLVLDPNSDHFARDLAVERLQWLEWRRRS